MNSKLYDNKYSVPKEILDDINASYIRYSNMDGSKRAKNILKDKSLTYQQLKRLKNYFDSADINSPQYLLAGGNNMKTFIERTLNDERDRVAKSTDLRRDTNIDLNNTLKTQEVNINSIHENDDKLPSDELSINVSGVIFDDENRILLLKRSSYEDQWQPNKFALVGGAVEKGENPEKALKREIKEETGINVDKFIEKFIIQRSSDQVEHIFIAKYDGKPEDIVVNKEHNGFGWFSYQEIRYLNTVPNLIDYVNIAVKNYNK